MPSPATAAITAATYAPSDVDPVVRQAYALFDARDFDAIPRVYTEDVVLTVVPTGETLHGHAGVEAFTRGWIGAFDDAHVEIELMIQAGDVAVVEFRGVGTHTGTLHTPMGDLPATGRSVNVRFCDVIRLRDGRVAAIHTYFDSGTFAAQLAG